MGWDAYSSAIYNWENNKMKDPELNRLFKNASNYVKRKAGTADFLLQRGGLDCSACAKMLEEATGKSAWDEKGWDKEEVQEIAKKAFWDFEYEKDDAWAYWSARKFLETCAKANLSISFTY